MHKLSVDAIAWAALAVSAGAVHAQAPDAVRVAGAAHGSDAREITRLAARYEHGEGVRRDYATAHRLYCQAARGGYAQAHFQLGWMYANGRGVDRDERTASALFERAAQLGHEHAQRVLHYLPRQASATVPACMAAGNPPSLRLAFTLTQAPAVPDVLSVGLPETR